MTKQEIKTAYEMWQKAMDSHYITEDEFWEGFACGINSFLTRLDVDILEGGHQWETEQ